MRAFLSSPYASHIVSPQDGRDAALRLMLSLRHIAPVVLHPAKMGKTGIFSPLPYGDIAWHGHSEEQCLAECLAMLELPGLFDTLIVAKTIPRKPGYGRNGCDREEELARHLGLTVTTDIDLIHG